MLGVLFVELVVCVRTVSPEGSLVGAFEPSLVFWTVSGMDHDSVVSLFVISGVRSGPGQFHVS